MPLCARRVDALHTGDGRRIYVRMNLTLNQVGPFQIQQQLVPGDEVSVYWATDTRTQHEIVLYVATVAQEQSTLLLEQLRQEVRVALAFQHEHVVPLAEVGRVDGSLYAATAPLPAGSPLASYLQGRKALLPIQEITTLLAGVAAGLDAAHQQGLLHLGLTPSEIWVSATGQAQIVGLGLPRRIKFATPGATTAIAAPQMVFNPSPFTAPEQVRGDEQVEQRADVYSLGAIAYYLLLGQLPIETTDLSSLPAEIAARPPTPPESIRTDLPRSAVSVLKFVLAKEPSLRYASAGEFVAALHQAQGGEGGAIRTLTPISATKSKPRIGPFSLLSLRYAWVAAGVLLVILLAGLFYLRRGFNPFPPAPALSMSTSGGEQVVAAATPTLITLTATTEPAASVTGVETPETPAPPQPATNGKEGAGATTPVATTAGLTTTQAMPVQTPGATTAVPPNDAVLLPTAGVTVTIPTPTPGATSTSTPVATATNTPSPTATPEPTATPRAVDAALTPVQFNLYFPLMAHRTLLPGSVNRPANLRSGPGTAFPVVRRVTTGDPITLAACNPGCTWYQLASGEWIAAFLVNGVANPRALLLPTPTGPPE